MRVLSLILTLCAAPVVAQDGLSGAEFEAFVAGRTMTFGTQGDPTYGVEQYLPGQRVIWSTGDGVCTHGVWYESKGDICFRYEHKDEAQCWRMSIVGQSLRAEFTNRPGTTVLTQAEDYHLPLICNDLAS